MGMALTLWLDYTFTENSNLKKVMLFIATILFSFSIGYSRFILGVHSLDQIIFGLLIGVWIAITMQFCVRPILEPHLE
jgi:membrane-associated phospholipid phosphatase